MKPKKFAGENVNVADNESLEQSSTNNENRKKITFSRCNFDKPSAKCNFVSKIKNLPLKKSDRGKTASEKQQNNNQDSAKNKRTLNLGAEINEKNTPFEEEIQLPIVQELIRLANTFDSLSIPQYNSFEKVTGQSSFNPVIIKTNENSNEHSDTVQKDYVPKMNKSEQTNRVSKSKEKLVKNVISNQKKDNTQIDNNTEKLNEKLFNKNDNFYNFMQTFSNNVFKTALEYVNKIKNM